MLFDNHSSNRGWQNEIEQVAHALRMRVLQHTVHNNGGYLSQACSSAEILATLYLRIMNLGAVDAPILPPPFRGVPGHGNNRYTTGALFNGPKGDRLDRFILSPSHYSLVLYALLVETGRMAPEGLIQFNQDGSTVEMIGAESSPGMEVMSGSLGQGISQAAGIAMARKLRHEEGKVWVFMSDGEFQIGQTWEALQALSFHGLDNVGIYIDANGYQCDGPMNAVMGVEPLEERLKSFGAHAVTVDGHNVKALARVAAHRPQESGAAGKPLVVVARTCPHRGIDLLKEREPNYHYVRFADPNVRERYRVFLDSMTARADWDRQPGNPAQREKR